MHKVSRIFMPVSVTQKSALVNNSELASKSQKLMLDLGLIKSASNGTYQIMPLAQRAIDKCIDLVQRSMDRAGCQKISLPVLTPTTLWQRSGRLDGDTTEFFKVRDRHKKEFLLSPTHEEAVTALLATCSPVSYKELPIRLYQIGPKFRDELRTRSGIIRAKEFLMKDLYTFDKDAVCATATYEEITEAYKNFLSQLELPYMQVAADTGIMGGIRSHEYHYETDIGEDILLCCDKCCAVSNAEAVSNKTCADCGGALRERRGLEIAHTFLLGDKYSKPLGALLKDEQAKQLPLVMGCYGIGISRLVAAALELRSTAQQLCWPKLLAPYDVCVIGPKMGSKEQSAGEVIENSLISSLLKICDEGELLYDDRKNQTIGKRLLDAKRIGYPLIVVIGTRTQETPPKVELHCGSEKHDLEPNELLLAVAKHVQSKADLRYGIIGQESRKNALVN